MSNQQIHCVTGAFGYSGRYIAAELLEAGHSVRTLTGSSPRVTPQLPDVSAVDVRPLGFDDPDGLTRSLEGVDVLYNTYWVRFNHRRFSHGEAVANSKILFDAAARAGVGRLVHVSITNPSLDSPFEYFRGKAELEQTLAESDIPHTILRPAVLFGGDDILINNIAWMLRRLPVIGLFGRGDYRLQPIHVHDFARLAVAAGQEKGDRTVDAIGPETFAYRELVATIARILGRRRLIVGLPPSLAYLFTHAMGLLLRDVIITWPEVGGLMADLLCTESTPTGTTRLTDWATEHANWLGKKYHSELARRR